LRRLAVYALLLFGCGHGTAADPFAGRTDAGAGGEGGEAGRGGTDPGTPGEACVDATPCDDGIACTIDSCDPEVGRCHHEPDDSACDNHVYCDGAERCSPTLDCQPGPVVSCSDNGVCSIDTCVEETQSCKHETRDADGDGDPPLSCGGTDCDDFDPLVSGESHERCANGRDDDCDGVIDEDDCVRPAHDRCGDALELTEPGTYAVSTIGASQDYAISCEMSSEGRAFRDVVLAVTVPGDARRDIDIVAIAPKSAPAPSVASVTETTFDDASRRHAVALPDDAASSDLLLVLFASQGGAAVTTPAGFRSVFAAVDEGQKVVASAYVASVNALEGATSVDLVTDDDVTAAAQVLRIRGASSASGVSAGVAAVATSKTPDPAAAAIPWSDEGDSLVLAFAATAGSPTLDSTPNGYSAGKVTATAKSAVISATRAVGSSEVDPGAFALEQKLAWAAGTIVVRPSSRQTFDMVLAAADKCDDVATETACERSVVAPGAQIIDRLLVRNAAPGAHLVYLATDREAEVEVHLAFREPEPAPQNETCGTSAELAPDVPVRAILTGVGTDLDTRCKSETGDLVYGFDLEKPSDVRLQAVSLDGYGSPTLSLRNAACTEASSELTCRAASPLSLYARALPAGSYRVALAATGPTEAEFTLAVSPATAAPDTEGCADPPTLDAGVGESVSFVAATDAVQIGCLVGAADATYRLELAERSDVMVVESGSEGDTGGVLVASAPCKLDTDAYTCRASDQWPVRAVAHGVGPGPVRAVVETAQGKPATITAFTRPAATSVFVQGADVCDDAFEIPASGGRFEGNTDNQFADYDVSCDYGGQGVGGAPEQLLRLVLTARSRVVLDASGSNYQTILAIRSADGCPGEEVPDACSVTYTAGNDDEPTFSFVDAELDPGTYLVQIDGYNGDKGRWALEVFTAQVNGDQGK